MEVWVRPGHKELVRAYVKVLAKEPVQVAKEPVQVVAAQPALSLAELTPAA